MTMKIISRYFFIGVLLILGSGFFTAYSVAQDAAPGDVPGNLPILEGEARAKKHYLLQISGTVMNDTFSGARALLTISGPLEGGKYGNPYMIVIQGFPKYNSSNSFYWDSETSEMRSLANDITCDIKRSFVRKTSQYFYFLSPALFRYTGEQEETSARQAANKKAAERVALPTFINSRAGQLKLRIHSNSVSGTVWMKGYDPVEKSFVLYSARLYGKKTYDLKPMQTQKKLTEVRE